MYQKVTTYLVHFLLIFSILTLYMELTQIVELHYNYITGIFTFFFTVYIYFTLKVYKIGKNLQQLDEKVNNISEQFES